MNNQNERKSRKAIRFREFGAIIGFALVFIAFGVITPGSFLSFQNIGSILAMASQLGIMAVGISFLMISGEFDLSVGSVYALSPIIMAYLVRVGINPLIALLVGLIVAGIVGLSNGLITLKGEIPSFITTLGMMMFIRGVIFAVTGGFPVLYKGHPLGLLPILNSNWGASTFRTSIIWFLFFVLLFSLILNRTAYGNWVQATGGNRKTAEALGINWKKVKITNFITCSVLAGYSGIINMSRFKTVEATLGEGMELEAIAVAVIGGNLLTGGHGTILGTLIGAILMGVIRSGLILVGAPAFWYRAFIGVVLIVAVVVNIRVQKKVA